MNDSFAKHYLEDAISNFRAHKKQTEKALSQVKDEELFQTLDEEGNSIAVITPDNTVKRRIGALLAGLKSCAT